MAVVCLLRGLAHQPSRESVCCSRPAVSAITRGPLSSWQWRPCFDGVSAMYPCRTDAHHDKDPHAGCMQGEFNKFQPSHMATSVVQDLHSGSHTPTHQDHDGTISLHQSERILSPSCTEIDQSLSAYMHTPSTKPSTTHLRRAMTLIRPKPALLQTLYWQSQRIFGAFTQYGIAQ